MTREAGADPPRGHIRALDGLRGVAILLVMAIHYTVVSGPPTVDAWFRRVTFTGWVGVDLFFVLSGFLITGILYDTKGSPNYYRTFYVRRSLRIFPLYYAFLFVFFWVATDGRHRFVWAPAHGGAQWWYLLTYSTNITVSRWQTWDAVSFPHFWSLAVEEQFYLFWPAVVLVLPRRRLMLLCGSLLVLATGWRMLLRTGLLAGLPILHHYVSGNYFAAYVLLPSRVDALAAGALLALVARGPGGLAALRRLTTPVVAGAGLTLVALFIACDLRWGEILMQAVGYTALAVLFSALLVRTVTAPPTSRLRRACEHPSLRFFGRYSYALYVVHIVVGNAIAVYVLDVSRVPTVAGSHLPGQILFMFVAVGASACVALVSWHVLEKRCLALKERFTYAPAARDTVPTSGRDSKCLQ